MYLCFTKIKYTFLPMPYIPHTFIWLMCIINLHHFIFHLMHFFTIILFICLIYLIYLSVLFILFDFLPFPFLPYASIDLCLFVSFWLDIWWKRVVIGGIGRPDNKTSYNNHIIRNMESPISHIYRLTIIILTHLHSQ